ncbi:hypothetical protein GIV40_00345 [Pseudomonas poae]|uniref:hypothetical protein n=1 Tax=Pseudomonas poae TaxID=200451 RepID=UPI001F47EFA4|nr:hypothetical protein [Pseudomonas poae]MCF5775537.1 hypothetical protein [Pseudomonas poae]
MTTMIYSSGSRLVLQRAETTAKVGFANLVHDKYLAGSFEAGVWVFRGRKISFCEKREHQYVSQNLQNLSETSQKIAKCFMIWNMRKHCSVETVLARLQIVKWVASAIQNDENWQLLTRHQIDDILERMKAYYSPATTYTRANDLRCFVKFLNNLQAEIDGLPKRFLSNHINWKHNLKNPGRTFLEQTSSEFEERSDKLFESQLHIALGKARSEIKANPHLENRPGSYMIRLEALSFAMALGLRVFEICTLPINAVDRSSVPGRIVIRVPTEKSVMPSITAVADIWETAILDANSYLLEVCAEARARAKDIEDNGFSFIRREISKIRTASPLREDDEFLLEYLDLSKDDHCFLYELPSSFGVYDREFLPRGIYKTCRVELPIFTNAKACKWIDDRILFDDWDSFDLFPKNHKPIISPSKFSLYLGTTISSTKTLFCRFPDFVAFLLKKYINLKHSFPPSSDSFFNTDQWIEYKKQLLMYRNSESSPVRIAIKLAEFERILKERYITRLSKHYSECLDAKDTHDISNYTLKNSVNGRPKKLSEHFIVVWEYQFANYDRHGPLPRPATSKDFYNLLSSLSTKPTVFKRANITDDNGNIFSFSPHFIRRWVTTALLKSGPTEHAIDLWMGRTPRQTRHYDYRTPNERAEYVRKKYLDAEKPCSDALGRKVSYWREINIPELQIEELILQKLKALHFTPWGTCSRELYISPCDKGLMCIRGFGTDLGCEYFHLDLNDHESFHNMENLVSQYEGMLNALHPNIKILTAQIESELNNSETLDQHLHFILDVVNSGKSILALYKTHHQSTKE